jgi:hypothetical protein
MREKVVSKERERERREKLIKIQPLITIILIFMNST